MAMGFGMMELLMVLLSGGGWGNDLLDYLPTNAYWKSKGVTVSVERLVPELAAGEPGDLAPLLRDLGAEKYETREAATAKLRAAGPAAIPALRKAAEADDPEVRTRARDILEGLSGGAQALAVRRLMAIRTLGELKRPEAVPALRPLLESKEPFVADYAARAIAAVEGRPHERPQATKEQAWSDVCLLPANCGIVAQMRMPGGQATSFEEVLKKVLPTLPMGQDAEKAVGELVLGITTVAEQIGNVRVDTLTFGVSDNIGNRSGCFVLVARGLYDAQAAKAALKKMEVRTTEFAGVEAFQPESEVRLLLASNERLIFTAGASPEQLPGEQLAAALKNPPDKPALGAPMLDLIKALDPASPAWVAVVMSDAYRQAPFLAPFDTITATGKNAEGGAMAITLAAAGKDPEAVRQAVAVIEGGVKQGLAEVKREAERTVFLKPLVEFMESIRIEAAGARATLTAKMKGQGAAIMMPMLMLFGARASAVAPDMHGGPMEAVPEPQ